MSHVELKNVTKSYDSKTKVINDVTLKIEDKEFQGLIDYMLSNNCKLEQEAIDWK